MEIPEYMHAMVLEAARQRLEYKLMPMPVPTTTQVLIKIIACGVCRTDLHIVDAELKHPKLPLIPGHEIVGMVVQAGRGVTEFRAGDMVGVPWLGYTCGICRFCKAGKENLCEQAGFTGYTIDGGYAEYTVADHRYCFSLPAAYARPAGAPLLCAGLIGYRSYSMIDAQAEKIGIYGFGAAAHILIQVAVAQHKRIYAFTRPGDESTRRFALELGAEWAGDSSRSTPVLLDAAIIFAPAGELVPKALQDTDRGGMVVCGGIHMSDIPSFPYQLLWQERVIRSVANLTRKDGEAFFNLLKQTNIETQIEPYLLYKANEALNDLRTGKIHGAAVLVMD